jgi:integrase
MSSNEKLDQILQDLELIKNHLKIVPDIELEITDYTSSVEKYEKFAKNELKLNEKTITNHLSTISRFLTHSQGIITMTTVTEFLDSNDSDSWKSNQIKALRKYLRDYLKLGNWINEFNFTKSKAKLKDELPNNDQLARFCSTLPYETQMVFLVMYTSGLRIGEVLSLKCSNYNIDTCMIDASNIHTGNTKSSWISFISTQAAEYFNNYFLKYTDIENDGLIFPINIRTVQNAFKSASDQSEIAINPHLLRTIFAEKCRESGIEKEYINAFCGRTSQGVLERNYTDYSPTALRKQYDKVDSFLTLSFDN